MIEPALTAEEWAVNRDKLDDPRALDPREYFCTGEFVLNAERHPLAALCLHGQPFGFTMEDVTVLKGQLSLETEAGNTDSYGPLKDLIARIEALLPPEAE